MGYKAGERVRLMYWLKDFNQSICKEVRKGTEVGILLFPCWTGRILIYPNMTRMEGVIRMTSCWKRFVNFNMVQLAELNKTWKPDLYWSDGDWEQTGGMEL